MRTYLSQRRMRLRMAALTGLVSICSILGLVACDPASAAPSPVAGAPAQIRGASFESTSANSFAAATLPDAFRAAKSSGHNCAILAFPRYVRQTATGITITDGANSTSQAARQIATLSAQGSGLCVIWKPLLERPDGVWRQTINPQNVTRGVQFRTLMYQAWGNWMKELGAQAQSLHVNMIIFGTEQSMLAGDCFNPSNGANVTNYVINPLASVYGGEITYGAQNGPVGATSPADELCDSFWSNPHIKRIGISGYFTIGKDTTTGALNNGSVAAMKAAWAKYYALYLKPLSDKFHKPVWLAEDGYCSDNDSRLHPWACTQPPAANQQEQANLYDATIGFLGTLPTTVFGGYGWWGYVADRTTVTTTDAGFSPQGKLAEQVEARYWGGKLLPLPAATVHILTPTNGAVVNDANELVLKVTIDGRSAATLSGNWNTGPGQKQNPLKPGGNGAYLCDTINLTGWTWPMPTPNTYSITTPIHDASNGQDGTATTSFTIQHIPGSAPKHSDTC